MKSTVKRIAATAAAAMMALTPMGSALAAEYYSGAISVGGRVVRPTAAPTAEPAAESAPEMTAVPSAEAEAPNEIPTAAPTVAATAKPTAKPTAEPAAEPTAEPEPVRLVLPLLGEEETELPMHAEPDAESEVIAVIPVGQMSEGKEIGEMWSLVAYEGAEGYVPTEKIALYNQDVTPEEEAIVRTITVKSSLEGQAVIEEGTMAVLTATLTGFEDVDCRMQWQYTPDGGETIVSVEGANGSEYAFTITAENAAWLWRLSVTMVDTE